MATQFNSLCFKIHSPGSAQARLLSRSYARRPAAPGLSTRGRRSLTRGARTGQTARAGQALHGLCCGSMLRGLQVLQVQGHQAGTVVLTAPQGRGPPHPGPSLACTLKNIIRCRIIAAGGPERFKEVAEVKQFLFAVQDPNVKALEEVSAFFPSSCPAPSVPSHPLPLSDRGPRVPKHAVAGSSQTGRQRQLLWRGLRASPGLWSRRLCFLPRNPR